MSFKYINPGYGGLFYNQSFNFGTYENFTYNPTHGVSFYSTNNDYGKGVALYWQGSTTDLYMKFDVFFHGTLKDSTPFIRVGASETIIQIDQQRSTLSITACNDSTLQVSDADTNINLDAVNTFWIHVKAGENIQWEVTVVVNGRTVIDGDSRDSSYIGKIAKGRAVVFEVSADLPMSNLIISDEEIDLKEVIVKVDSSAVETTMTEDDGKYSTVQVDDYVLQTLDTSRLRSTFGSDGKITGMVAIAAPAYTTGEDITKLKCRKVDGETVTDYVVDEDDFIAYELHSLRYVVGEIGNSLPVCAEQIPVDSDTTIESVDGLKIGWVTVA